MIKDLLKDKELAKLSRDELYLYIILKTSEYLKLKKISYAMIKEVYQKQITNIQIDNLMKNLIKKRIIKTGEFILSGKSLK